MDNSDSGPRSSDATGESAAHHWGPDPRLRWISVAAAVAAVVWALVASDAEDRLVAQVLTVAFLALALLLVRVRVRLAADSSGITVSGPLRRRTLAWTDVVSITSPLRGRFGRRAASLEVEYLTGSDTDPQLFAFGSFELGTDPARVARVLARLRSGGR